MSIEKGQCGIPKRKEKKIEIYVKQYRGQIVIHSMEGVSERVGRELEKHIMAIAIHPTLLSDSSLLITKICASYKREFG